MADNPLAQLPRLGQSVWYDQMQRSLLDKGTLKKLIEEDDLRGLTSNPTIFEKAIAGTSEYDDVLSTLARRGDSAEQIYDALVLDDIGRAADVFRPVYDRTEGADGYVSIEVSPTLAHDTAATVKEAMRLHHALDRPNVMIKVPATPEGIPAIRELIASGVSVNVTLIFARSVYDEVINAYISGLEDRLRREKPLDRVASVASFFVSRIDSKVDAKLDLMTDENARNLKGKAAIANAKLAYQLFLERFSSDRFAPLRERGARVQRPLWASTGTKNPQYSDVLYVETLIGRDTVNTVPPATYDAFRDHGTVTETITQDVDQAKETLERLAEAGIDLDAITDELTREGVKSFSDSFVSLMATIEARKDTVVRINTGREVLDLCEYSEQVEAARNRAAEESVIPRIWKRDPAVWSSDEAAKRQIANSLGWVAVPQQMREQLPELQRFADEVRSEFKHVVVLGMGGSSLCAEVLRSVFGIKAGFPELHVLDSTVPAAIRNLESRIDLQRTLFIVASKSGTTIEPAMFQKYFFARVSETRGDPGMQFVAITDPETHLDQQARRDGYRRVFVNPADIGGRYSALSLFGLVPAALCGVDIVTFLDRASHAMHACSPSAPIGENPAVALGSAMGELARAGRDKLTLFTSPRLHSLALWIEQLVAESCGKSGVGILPVRGDSDAAPGSFSDDRFFVWIRTATEDDSGIRSLMTRLREAGHPTSERVLADPLDLADEFYVWELATAIAGWILGVNPFDQPNVQEAKDRTGALLEAWRSGSAAADLVRVGGEESVEIYAADAAGFAAGGSGHSLEETFATYLAPRTGGYAAVMQFLPETAEVDREVDSIRRSISEAFRVAVTTGYGPRFLHSTGQLHKGGGDNGVFLQIVADDPADIPIPGEQITFGTLARAQSLGDLQALASRGRRAIQLRIRGDVAKGLARIREAAKAAAERTHQPVA